MSKPQKEKEPGAESIAMRVAAIVESDARVLSERVEEWRSKAFFIDPAEDKGRRMTAKTKESADVFVATAMARLLQVGVTDTALKPLAEICCNVVGAATVQKGDLWLGFCSGGQPVVITQRARMIDFVARAKGKAATVLDLSELLVASQVL